MKCLPSWDSRREERSHGGSQGGKYTLFFSILPNLFENARICNDKNEKNKKDTKSMKINKVGPEVTMVIDEKGELKAMIDVS